MEINRSDFTQVNFNVLCADIDGGFFGGGSTVTFQEYVPYDKVTYAGKLKSSCVFIDGKIKLEPVKVGSFYQAIKIANQHIN